MFGICRPFWKNHGTELSPPPPKSSPSGRAGGSRGGSPAALPLSSSGTSLAPTVILVPLLVQALVAAEVLLELHLVLELLPALRDSVVVRRDGPHEGVRVGHGLAEVRPPCERPQDGVVEVGRRLLGGAHVPRRQDAEVAACTVVEGDGLLAADDRGPRAQVAELRGPPVGLLVDGRGHRDRAEARAARSRLGGRVERARVAGRRARQADDALLRGGLLAALAARGHQQDHRAGERERGASRAHRGPGVRGRSPHREPGRRPRVLSNQHGPGDARGRRPWPSFERSTPRGCEGTASPVGCSASAPLAQLDRATASGAVGQRFESSVARQESERALSSRASLTGRATSCLGPAPP